MTNSEHNALTQLVTDAWQRDRARQQRDAEQIARDQARRALLPRVRANRLTDQIFGTGGK